MKILYKLSLLLFLLPTLLTANPGNGKYTKTKKLSKTFSVNKDCLVDIRNEFGNVTITTWDKSTVSIDITVEVSGNDEQRIMDKLRNIDVAFSATASMVSARTNTEQGSKKNNGLWNTLFHNDYNQTSNMKIDYIIKMPVTASLDISNDYGAIILDRLKGQATIKCDFGRLDIGQLLADNNYLKFDYTNNSHIDYMKSGSIRADFSGFELHGADRIEYKGDYTKGTFENITYLEFNGDFCTIQSEIVGKIVGRGDYSTIKLGIVEERVELNTDFGSIRIEALGPHLKEATIRSEYTGIKIGYHPKASFNFDINTAFASIKLSDDLVVTRSENSGTDKQKSGYCITQRANALIRIRSSFGSVSLMKN
jgi:hypothetical protein